MESGFKIGQKVWWKSTISPSTVFQITGQMKVRNKVNVHPCTRVDGRYGDRKEKSFIYPQPHQLIPYNENQTVIKWERDGHIYVKMDGKWLLYSRMSRGQKRLLNRAQKRAIHKILSET